MAKIKFSLSVNPETVERLKQYAKERHTTVAQAITDWIWSQKVNESENSNPQET